MLFSVGQSATARSASGGVKALSLSTKAGAPSMTKELRRGGGGAAPQRLVLDLELCATCGQVCRSRDLGEHRQTHRELQQEQDFPSLGGGGGGGKKKAKNKSRQTAKPSVWGVRPTL